MPTRTDDRLDRLERIVAVIAGAHFGIAVTGNLGPVDSSYRTAKQRAAADLVAIMRELSEARETAA
ncbi:MAG: hypothetical protein ACXVUL_10060 [Solirubrobacteraceae bacterium]